MHACMTKVISISDEAYEKLSRMKNDKSFSKIIVELVIDKSKDDLMQFAGLLTSHEAEKIKEGIYHDRKDSSRRFK